MTATILDRLVTPIRFTGATLIGFTIFYTALWVRGVPSTWIADVWTWCILIVVPPLMILQILVFLCGPTPDGKAIVLDVLTFFMLYLVGVMFFAGVYYRRHDDFGMPDPIEVKANRDRLKEIEQLIQGDSYRGAEAEDVKRIQIEKRIHEEALSLAESWIQTGEPLIDLRYKRDERRIARRKVQGFRQPLTFSELQRLEFFQRLVRKKYEMELGGLNADLLYWRTDLLEDVARLRATIEQYSFLNVLYVSAGGDLVLPPRTPLGKLLVIAQRLWTIFLLTVYLAALQRRLSLSTQT